MEVLVFHERDVVEDGQVISVVGATDVNADEGRVFVTLWWDPFQFRQPDR